MLASFSDQVNLYGTILLCLNETCMYATLTGGVVSNPLA